MVVIYWWFWCRDPLITMEWAVREAHDINTSHTLFRGCKEGNAYIAGDVILSYVLVWMSNIWGKQ
jgi:hypothetical protein